MAFLNALDVIDRRLGKDTARNHLELVVAFMHYAVIPSTWWSTRDTAFRRYHPRARSGARAAAGDA
jgi:hypothetical protein